MKQKIDKIWVGVVMGILGAFFGFFLFGIGFSWKNEMTFSEFYNIVFLGIKNFQSRIVTISVLVDVILFFWFIRKGYQKLCQGLMVVMILSVVAVAWLY